MRVDSKKLGQATFLSSSMTTPLYCHDFSSQDPPPTSPLSSLSDSNLSCFSCMTDSLASSGSVAVPPAIDAPSHGGVPSSSQGQQYYLLTQWLASLVPQDGAREHWDNILESSKSMSHAQVAISPSASTPTTAPNFLEVTQKRRVAKDKVIQVSVKRRKVEAKYICDMEGCGQTFTALHNLKNHRNSHLGARPYRCPNCGRSFVTTSNRKRHGKKCRTPGST